MITSLDKHTKISSDPYQIELLHDPNTSSAVEEHADHYEQKTLTPFDRSNEVLNRRYDDIPPDEMPSFDDDDEDDDDNG